MSARQSRQHVRTGCSSLPAAGRNCVDKADDTLPMDFAVHQKVLKYLEGARDLSMLEQKQPAVLHLEMAGVDMAMEDEASTIDAFIYLFQNTPFLQLCMRALANSINVILQDFRGSLLDHGTALDVVSSLCYVIATQIKQAALYESLGRCQGIKERANSAMNASGLLPVLSRFSEAVWHALQQVDVDERQQQPVQPKPAARRQRRQEQLRQESLRDRWGTAAAVIHKLLVLWQQVLANSHLNPSRRHSPFVPAAEGALPALIAFTTTAVWILKKARASIASSSCRHTKVAAYDSLVELIAVTGLPIAGTLSYMNAVWMDQQFELKQQQQHLQYCLLTEKLPELLLQLLAHQANQLHTACGGVSLAKQDSRAAAAAAAAHVSQQDHHQPQQQQQQQQQQPQQLLGGFVVPSSHLTLLDLLDLAHTDDLGRPYADIPTWKSAYAHTLNVLSRVVLERFWRAAHLNKTRQDADQQQQEQKKQQSAAVDDSLIVLPQHLVVPTIKVLIEVVLLLPAGDLVIHECSMRLILTLLHTSASPTAALQPPTAATTAAAGAAALQDKAPWLRLPAAVAAGLVQPVVCQLSQAVIYGLLQTEGLETDIAKAARLSLLHNYGSLLITVCQSVESKHIGAVLQSQSTPDLLITLAAAEAVIRAQACHLAPDRNDQQQLHHHCQQQQQQQSVPSAFSSFDVPSGITQHPLDQAPLLLLPFVSAFLRALEGVISGPHQQQHVKALLDGASSSIVDKLSIRLVTLLQTALKVSRCAIARAAAAHSEEEQAEVLATAASGACNAAPTTASAALSEHERACKLAMNNSLFAGMVAYWWFDTLCATTNRLRNNCGSSKVQAMQVGLSLRALHAWTCAWSSLAPAYEIPAATTVSSLQGVGCAKSVGPLPRVLLSMAAAFSNTKYVLEGPAAQAMLSAAVSAGNVLLNEPQRCDDAGCGVHTILHLGQIEAFLRATMRVAITEAGTCSPSEATTNLASKSDNELCHILKAIELVRPSSALLTSMKCSAGMLEDLADKTLSGCLMSIVCNNPMCMNLSKLSEWQLVCGSSCVCAGCGLARYCCKNCLVHHWQLHKPVCR